ncbi:MAG: ATP-binding cassette domain-containing protein [Desulfobacteraceae bacterium]|nr:ATP-binding cassette domain-containing protein [Desulfobacteraceae bacterium]
MKETFLSIDKLNKSFFPSKGKTHHQEIIIKNFSIDVAQGEVIALFGPNGCGKSTLLNILAGIEQPDSGEINYRSDQAPSVGYAFQQYENSLFPWRTIIDNITLKYEIDGMSRAERIKKGIAFAEKFGVTLDWKAYPYQLSGGQKQIIALMRALIYRPDFCVLDEPLSSLDYQNSLDIMRRLSLDWTLNNITALIVSHDIEQAIFLADRVVVLTSRPMAPKTIFHVPFKRPRTIDVIKNPLFVEIRNKALKAFVEEISN